MINGGREQAASVTGGSGSGLSAEIAPPESRPDTCCWCRQLPGALLPVKLPCADRSTTRKPLLVLLLTIWDGLQFMYG